MSSRVEQDVRYSVPDLPRRPEHVDVIAVREHRPFSPEDAVHGPREPRTERFHPPTEVGGARCLDDQVYVVGLDGVLDQSEPAALAGPPEGDLYFSHETRAAQGWYVLTHAQGHVARVSTGEGGTASMGVAPDRSLLAACAGSATTPVRRRTEIETQLCVSTLHESHADIMMCQMRSRPPHVSDLIVAMF